MLPPEKKLKQIEDENARLKRTVTDLTLDCEMLQDVIRAQIPGPDRKREVLEHMCRHWMASVRRACGALNFDRPPATTSLSAPTRRMPECPAGCVAVARRAPRI